MWIPPVFFENTKDSDEILNDKVASAYVTRNGTFNLVGLDEFYNTEVYLGSENPITLSRIYRKEFICIYEIAWYPFDTQRCRITLSIVGNSDEFVNLLPGNLRYSGPKDLTIYFIKKTAIHRGRSNEKMVVYVEVTLGRRLLSTILTVYLPTVLLNVIGFSTNFFKVGIKFNKRCLMAFVIVFGIKDLHFLMPSENWNSPTRAFIYLLFVIC